MRRRDFIKIISSSAAAWPLAASAQQAGELPTIGFLGTDATGWRPWTDAFVARLRELGWIDGQTIAIEYRWDEGRPQRDVEVAAEFVRLKVDAIVTNEGGASASKQSTAVIPIIFVLAPDPIGARLVANLARPGGNVSGLSLQQTDLGSKKLEFLHRVVARLRRLAVMLNAGYPATELELHEVQAAAHPLDLEVVPLEIRRAEDITQGFAALKSQTDALYVIGDALTFANRTRIITLALGARLPTIFADRSFVQAGGLMSYGANFPDLFRRTAELTDKVLRGASPGDIPVEQPTKFELVINLTTAKALQLEVPHNVLVLADEVIE
jgi:putative tryptophan/tyrosine transport system substrate-binding protein